MKSSPTQIKDQSLSQPLTLPILSHYRLLRNFNPQSYAKKKSIEIKRYLNHFNMSRVVIASSGGIDSATCLSLAAYTKKTIMPELDITVISFPTVDCKQSTNQQSILDKSMQACASAGILNNFCHLDLSNIHSLFSADLFKTVSAIKYFAKQDDWALGQFVAHCRTPALYYTATLLAPALILGTTNKDEGHYLGYVGKASDGLVDLQIVSDLHKSEVFKLAKFLNVPQSILNAKPHGDMFDGRCDEEFFGAPYQFVELYHYLKQVMLQTNMDLQSCLQYFISLFSLPHSTFSAIPLLQTMAENLEKLHTYNRHKYLSCSSAIHLDILADFSFYPETLRSNLSFANDIYYPKEKISIDQLEQFEKTLINSKQEWLGLNKTSSTTFGQMGLDYGIYS